MDRDKNALAFSFSGVIVTSNFVGNVRKNEITFSIPRDTIQSLELLNGFTAERPILQAAFGILLACAGCVPFVVLAIWIRSGGTLLLNFFLVIWMLPLGIWLVGSGMRRGLYIGVTMTGKGHKVAFRGKPSAIEANDFLSDASSRYGYSYSAATDLHALVL